MISPCSLGKREAEFDEAQADPHETEDDAGERHPTALLSAAGLLDLVSGDEAERIATIAVIVKQPTMPHTRDAMANPFVPVFGAAEYGVAGWGGGEGRGAGPRSGSCGGVAVIALPPG
jgi:hypothetical protein